MHESIMRECKELVVRGRGKTDNFTTLLFLFVAANNIVVPGDGENAGIGAISVLRPLNTTGGEMHAFFFCKNKLDEILPIFNEILSSYKLSFPKSFQKLTKTLNRYKFFLFTSPPGGHPTGFDICYSYTGKEKDGSENDDIFHPFKRMIEDTVKLLPGPTELARHITSLLKQKTTEKDDEAADSTGLSNDVEMEPTNIYDHPSVENMVSPTSVSGAIGLLPGKAVDTCYATEGMRKLLNYDLFTGTTGGHEDNQIPTLGDFDAESTDKTNVEDDVGGNIMLVEDICDEYLDHLANFATSSTGQAFHLLIDYHPIE